jgi:hypothetical protein
MQDKRGEVVSSKEKHQGKRDISRFRPIKPIRLILYSLSTFIWAYLQTFYFGKGSDNQPLPVPRNCRHEYLAGHLAEPHVQMVLYWNGTSLFSNTLTATCIMAGGLIRRVGNVTHLGCFSLTTLFLGRTCMGVELKSAVFEPFIELSQRAHIQNFS